MEWKETVLNRGELAEIIEAMHNGSTLIDNRSFTAPLVLDIIERVSERQAEKTARIIQGAEARSIGGKV